MQFSELVKHRQSDRKYSQKTVEKEKIELCLEAARLAPSACNSQPWKFIVVDNPKLKEQVAACASDLVMNRFANQAPVIVALVLEKMNFTAKIGSILKDKEYFLLDVGIAAEHFCLQAADIGLGTCMIGWFDEKKVRELLKIPGAKRVPLLITIGYSESPHHAKPRKAIEKMSNWNKY